MRSAVAALLLVAGCAAPPPGLVVVEEDVPQRPLGDGRAPVARVALHESDAQSIAVLRIDGLVAPHRHLHSQETVYVISGKGTLLLEDATRDLEPGDLVVVPRNTLHGFAPIDGPAVVLSIFSPPFREGDRVLEDVESRTQRDK